MKPFVVAAALAVLSAGCISTLSVEKVEPGQSAKGLVYSLPKTYLVVKPKPDGTMDVHFTFLPDPANTYAISASSWFSKHELALSLTPSGLLQDVDWKPDSTGVASKLVEAAGKIYSAEKDEEAKKKEDKKRASDDAKKKVADAEAAVKAANRTLELRRSELSALEMQLAQMRALPNPDPAAIDLQELTIFKKEEEIRFAEEDLAAAEAALAEVTAAAGASGDGTGGGEGGGGEFNEIANATDEGPKSWGGMLYEVLEQYDWHDLDTYRARSEPKHGADGRKSGPGATPIAAHPRLRAVQSNGEPQVQFPTRNVPPAKSPKVALELESGPEFLLPASRPTVIVAQDKRDHAQQRRAFLESVSGAGGAVSKDAILAAQLEELDTAIVYDQTLASEKRDGFRLLVRASSPVARFISAVLVDGGGTSIPLALAELSNQRVAVFLPFDADPATPDYPNPGSYRLEIQFAKLDPKDSNPGIAKLYLNVR